jgi:hypothetical protein
VPIDCVCFYSCVSSKGDLFPDDFVPVDPHIRVGGTSDECVRRAKAMIMDYLDTKTSRVTMKMDVSYTDHSHVIGKGGNQYLNLFVGFENENNTFLKQVDF